LRGGPAPLTLDPLGRWAGIAAAPRSASRGCYLVGRVSPCVLCPIESMSNPNPSSSDTATGESDDFLSIRNHLFQEIALLSDLWEQYRTLFLTSATRVTRLNEHARWFFASVQRAFLNQLILGISKITDPAKSGSRRNVSLLALLEDPRLAEKPKLSSSLVAQIDEVTRAAASIRSHRNKTVAHLDHAVAFGYDPLPQVTLDQIGSSIALVQQIHHLYGTELLDSDAYYRIHASGSAEQLLETLEIAPTRRERELQQELIDLQGLRNTDHESMPESL